MSKRLLLILSLIALLAVAPTALAQTADPTPAPTEAAPAEPPIPKVHIVQDGETLTSIAGDYGLSVERLLQANSIADPSFLYVGQELIIPDTSGDPFDANYVVRLGDTLESLAADFNTTVADIVAANRLLNPRELIAGKSLTIISRTGSSSPVPLTGRPHLVQPGESLLMLAAAADMTPMALAQFNELPYPTQLYAGQRLRLPGDARFQDLPGDWVRVELGPLPVQQGRAMSLYVQNNLDGQPSGQFLDQSLQFAPYGDGFITMIGLGAFTRPGVYELMLGGSGSRPWTPLRQWVQVDAYDYGRQELTVPEEKGYLLAPDVVNAENELLASIYGQFTPVQQWTGLFQQPIISGTQITAGYGIARSYNGGPYDSFHSGTDFADYAGTKVLAPNAGTIVASQPMQVRGNVIIIDHGLGVMTGYYHLQKLEVNVGDHVEAGQVIGELGTTGLSTGPHLHWDVRIMNHPVNPLQWLEQLFPVITP
ncbi:MAG: LysM peptidoglycan-binding domain-containing protein [Anaerolineales bacterium]|nr:LysM peptidoglycan-binding domain-containing protein [Anaerolineales bacterium]MCB8954450.1 LysM peptidoglycan-binding domain-containing protein [Ardenticatenales bacterium]